MTLQQHLSWQNFLETVFLPGEERVHKVCDSPSIELFGDGTANRMGMVVETPPDTRIPDDLARLVAVSTTLRNIESRTYIEISTSMGKLHRQFYHFAEAVAERLIAGGTTPVAAISDELLCFSDLFEETALLGTERQIGLLGELLFLELLIARMGPQALDSWLGPLGEPHDFRVGAREFEVKTTVATRRIHVIHGLEQLVPSADCSLFLVSIMLGPPGAGVGFTLAGQISALFERFASSELHAKKFEKALRESGWRAEHSAHYTRNYAIRRPMALAPINVSFPVISRPTIQHALGALANRIGSLQYEVNVEGLECEDSSKEFTAILSPA